MSQTHSPIREFLHADWEIEVRMTLRPGLLMSVVGIGRSDGSFEQMSESKRTNSLSTEICWVHASKSDRVRIGWVEASGSKKVDLQNSKWSLPKYCNNKGKNPYIRKDTLVIIHRHFSSVEWIIKLATFMRNQMSCFSDWGYDQLFLKRKGTSLPSGPLFIFTSEMDILFIFTSKCWPQKSHDVSLVCE